MNDPHPLWRTLRSLRGNQRACVVTEPLWAIPNNLFLPFASVYMAAVGLRDEQIGFLASLGLVLRLVWGLLSGAVADKYGRRRMTLLFGLLGWAVPCLLWGTARGYPCFLAAVFFNSMQQVVNNCFSCLIVEDGDTDRLVHIYAILNLIGLVSGFLSPLAGLCIDRFALVPTMRAVYLVSMLLMALKFLLQYRLTVESRQGVRRIGECRGRSVFALTFGGGRAALSAFRQPRLLLCVALGALLTCCGTVQAAFWPLFVTRAYGVGDSRLAVFALVSSLTSAAAYLLVTPRIRLRSIRFPLLGGLGLRALGQLVLLACIPSSALWAVFFSAVCEAFALAVLGPLFESIMSVVIPAGDRARTNSLIFAVIFLVGTPAGWAAGSLSQLDRALPMLLSLGLTLAAAAVAVRIVRVFRAESGGAEGEKS